MKATYTPTHTTLTAETERDVHALYDLYFFANSTENDVSIDRGAWPEKPARLTVRYNPQD